MDGSLAVIDDWKARLPHIIVLEQENQGVSVARNTGLAVASGKYLAFPDIDDKLYPGMYRTLLEMAEKGRLDVATCNGRYGIVASTSLSSLISVIAVAYQTPCLSAFWLSRLFK